MATKLPRINVALPAEVYATITRLAQLQGRSRSFVIRDLLVGIHPPLVRTVALLDAARTAPAEVKQGLRGVLEDIERQMVSASSHGLDQLDWVREQAAGGAEAQPRPASPSQVHPPLSNTGGRSASSRRSGSPKR
jgi:hypothetical protein